MSLQFYKKHPLLVLEDLAGISKQARFEARCRKALCKLDSAFALDTDRFYDESKPILDYLREKLSIYNDGCGLGILEFHLVVALYCFLRAVKPELVLETGTASGASTYTILKALAANNRGKLHSVDLPQQQFGATNNPGDLTQKRPKETAWLVREGLSDLSRWELHLGDSHQLLPKLFQTLHGVDVFIHDSEHTYETMVFEFQTAWPRLKPTGYLLSDDLNCSNAFQEFCGRHRCRSVEIGRFGFASRKP